MNKNNLEADLHQYAIGVAIINSYALIFNNVPCKTPQRHCLQAALSCVLDSPIRVNT